MTLRARIAAVAGLAVALAILATAVFTYVAVRSSLRGEVDSALRERADRFDRAGTRSGGGPRARARARRRMNRLRPGGGGIHLRSPRHSVERILRITRLDTLLRG